MQINMIHNVICNFHNTGGNSQYEHAKWTFFYMCIIFRIYRIIIIKKLIMVFEKF